MQEEKVAVQPITDIRSPRLLFGGSILAALLALWIVSMASLSFYHEVRHDYLVTGLLAGGLLSSILMAVVIAARQELNHVRLNVMEREQQIRRMAHIDPLTGLPNRILLQDRFAKAMAAAGRSRESLALLFVDMDRFKAINDSLGHHIGDLLLKMVAERLASTLRDADTLSRLGGDEFVLLLPRTDAAGAAHIANRIGELLSQPYVIEQRNLHVTPSIGISVYPDDGFDMESLLKNADAAMYHVKGKGRNGYQFFRKEMNDAALERMSLEAGLRQALERREFSLVFQPQIDMTSGEIVSVEALTRWHYPGKGPLLPEKFIRLAEECGLILHLGEWILREACRQNALWHESGLLRTPIAVNLSALQFKQASLLGTVRQILQESDLEPRYLELELTESIVTDDTEAMVRRLWEFRDIGVHFSVDEFGTSYSSIGYLKQLPIDKLKIDRSFVQDVPHNQYDAIIVRSIIDLAHSLDLRVVAEGVEKSEQLEFLRRKGCDAYQGYLFGKPLPAEELTVALRNSKSGILVHAGTE